MSEPEGFLAIGDWARAGPYRGALVLPEDREGRLLLQLRDLHAPVHPGEWGLFGGGVEPGETVAEAALREFEEETGVRLAAVALRPFARIVSPVSRGRLYVFETAFEAAPEAIRLREGAGFAFVPPAEAMRLDLVPATRLALAARAGRR